ncbi:RagB/SusD family nutrient uptake outer membrane protein [Pinibacter aurantiacus]|uniref:RagB/SusD family nutrient uptake outer membrane protein n=1 Tax=Pinibacter aurantiacus TaxID=2851599 RepID=A0A9E2W526_9BACT|nr:RagB/SusD family nutrient uptake outer membrane protein [Pinibacter aurantiacus]MBV4360405.1 RagB/SusD family nutrient uptake outer membrane protein [Pinibacter aurantiacus]
MKKLISYILLSTVVFASCKKTFLDENMQSAYAPQNTLSDSLGFEANMAGILSRIRAQYTSDDDQGLLGAMFLGTDVVINGQTTAAMFPYVNNETMSSSDFAAGTYWRWAYTTLNNINTVIAASQNPAVTGTSENNKAYVGAEAKFYRAYVYNFLVTLWGPVPLTTTPISSPKTDFTRASVDSVNTQIVKDLTEAVAVLPADPKSARKEFRPNKAMCQQLLAEVYLRMNKPDLSEAQCQAVIANPAFTLIKARYGVKGSMPGDYYNDMFIQGNQRYGQGNKEALWVIEQDLNTPGGANSSSSNASTDQHRRMWVPYYAGITNMVIADSLGGRGIGRFRLSNWVMYGLYDQYDIRNSKYNFRRELRYNDPSKPKYGQVLTIADGDTVWHINPYVTKWNNYNPADINGYGTYHDITVMRLGETYLLLAEAQFKQNRAADAAASINVLRQRAYPDYPAHGQVQAADISLNFILDERARELISEENRRMTLIRTGTLVQRCTDYLNKYNTASGQPVTGLDKVTTRKGLLPIPQSAIDLNTGAKLDQNAGY